MKISSIRSQILVLPDHPGLGLEFNRAINRFAAS